jgi:hypothetical protein
MKSFTTKMTTVLGIKDTYPGTILTPGRTDKKIIKDQDPEPNDNYRSHVGTLNWLSMGIRFDVVYTTKELSRVLATPTQTANDIVRRALLYISRTKDAYLSYSHAKMIAFKLPPTRKKPTDVKDNYETSEYNIDDGIKQEDTTTRQDDYHHNGPTMHVHCLTDIDLAGQIETRQSTSSLMIWIQGALVHWRATTEKIVIASTAAGEDVALSRGNTTAKFVRNILQFYGNGTPNYFLYTDNQAAEHIATQPNMNEHSRSIDIRHHVIRQDYINGEMRIGGVSSQANTSDILTKNLQPPLHLQHTRELNIANLDPPTDVLTNCVVRVHYDNTPAKCLQPSKPKHIYSHGCLYTVNHNLILDPKTNTVAHKSTHLAHGHHPKKHTRTTSTNQR